MKKKVLFIMACAGMLLWGISVLNGRKDIERMGRKLDRSELYGNWILSDRSKRSLSRFGHSQEALADKKNFLVLDSQRATGILTLFHGLSPNGTIHSVDSPWELFEEGTGTRYKHTIRFREGTLASYKLRVSEIDGKLVIWNYIHDPDDIDDLYVLERR